MHFLKFKKCFPPNVLDSMTPLVLVFFLSIFRATVLFCPLSLFFGFFLCVFVPGPKLALD